MSSYRESSNAAKAVRRGITEAKPVGSKNKAPRPVVVESRRKTSTRPWVKWGAYRNAAEAGQALDQLARKYTFAEFRIKPPAGAEQEGGTNA